MPGRVRSCGRTRTDGRSRMFFPASRTTRRPLARMKTAWREILEWCGACGVSELCIYTCPVKIFTRCLSDCAQGNVTLAEKFYFSRRQEGLKVVHKEYMRHFPKLWDKAKLPKKSKEIPLPDGVSSGKKQDGQFNRYDYLTILRRTLLLSPGLTHVIRC